MHTLRTFTRKVRGVRLYTRGRDLSVFSEIAIRLNAIVVEHFGERHKVADRKTEPSKTVAVMGVEPIPGWEPEDIQKWYSQHHNEAGLAKAFAVASNKFWCVEDTAYDYEKESPEYREACSVTAAWGNIMDQLENEIFAILKHEGVVVPETEQIKVLSPFMERNGYCVKNGWGCPKK